MKIILTTTLPEPLPIYKTPLDSYIARYKSFAYNPSPEQIEFAKHFFKLFSENNDTDKVSVLPGRCGIGKSTAVQALVSYLTQEDDYTSRDEPIGAVIVTDALERLENIHTATPDNIEKRWKEGYQKYESNCSYIRNSDAEGGKSVINQLIESRKKPIVLLSTQRYFKMPSDLRDILFSFVHNEKTYNREIVIIDERPYFYTVKDLNVKNLNDCYTAIFNGIPSTNINKDWVLREFTDYRDKLELKFKEKEKCEDKTDRFYWKDINSKGITSNDKRFFGIIYKNERTIKKEYPDFFDDIVDFKQIQEDGAFFITQKLNIGQDYKTYLEIIKDNKCTFFIGKNKAKFIVLDATADIDPSYRIDYVEIENCDKYNIPLNLIINQLDVNTSKSKIVNNVADNYIRAIIESTKEKYKESVGCALLTTYKKIEDKFEHNGYEVSHFGGLKGSNSFTEIPNMFHIGLNRFSDFTYLLLYLAQNNEEYVKLKKLGELESREYINRKLCLKNGLFVDDEINNIMLHLVFVDFEQNIFRTAIRKYGSEEQITVWTYWSCDMFNNLNDMIKKRYLKYGVKFNDCGVPHQIEKWNITNRNTENKTIPQKIIEWFDEQKEGRIFRKKDMLTEIKITDDQFNNARKNTNYIKELWNQHKTDVSGTYQI